MPLFDVELELRFATFGSGETSSFWSYVVAAADDQQAARDKAKSLVETHFRKFAPLVSAFEVQVVSVRVAPEGCPISQLDGMGAWTYEPTRREGRVDSAFGHCAGLGEDSWGELLERLCGVLATFARGHNGQTVLAFGADTDIFNGEMILCASLAPPNQEHSNSCEWTHQDIGVANAEWMKWWGTCSRQIQEYFSDLDFADAEENRNAFMTRLVRIFLLVEARGVLQGSSVETRAILQIIDHEDSLDIAVGRVARERAYLEGEV